MSFEKLDLIKQFNVPVNGKRRVDCPFCFHKNTLSISNIDGKLVWFCFSASCGERGAASNGRSVESMRTRLENREAILSQKFHLPDYLVQIGDRRDCLRYLDQNHALAAYLDNRAKVLYDPKQNRCVFVATQDGIPVDATGRALDRSVKPKWLRYGNSGEGFLCPAKVRTSVCIVVEDCASACAASCAADGFALMGTNLLDSHVVQLRKYERVFIALDKDATKKGVAIASRLSYLVSSRALRLEEDIKYLDEAAVRDLI
jgi:hypothetical protein